MAKGPNFTEAMLKTARDMSDAELRRHASVSTQNRHKCDDCFCCACVAELEKRADIRDKVRSDIQNNPGSWDW